MLALFLNLFLKPDPRSTLRHYLNLRHSRNQRFFCSSKPDLVTHITARLCSRFHDRCGEKMVCEDSVIGGEILLAGCSRVTRTTFCPQINLIFVDRLLGALSVCRHRYSVR